MLPPVCIAAYPPNGGAGNARRKKKLGYRRPGLSPFMTGSEWLSPVKLASWLMSSYG